MKYKKLSIYLLICLLGLTLILSGCQSAEENSDSSSGNDEVATTFTPANSTKIQNSIFDLPGSITTSMGSSSTMRNIAGKPNFSSGGSNDQSGIFSGVTQYVSTAEMFKDFVKQFMANVVGSGMLQNAELDTVYSISDDSDDDSPTGIMVQKPTGEAYEWKVNLYFDASPDVNSNPGLIARLTIGDSGARGRILWAMTEADDEVTTALGTPLDITRYIDITFDGTTSTKSLELKYVGDMANYTEHAQTYWGTMSTAQKEALDLGQPEKVFLTAQYDSISGEYTLYATSYHPGWAIESTLDGSDSFWGPGHSMYMFKVKAVEGSTNGAKLFLALPHEDTTNTANVWTDDALGNLFIGVLVDQINGYTTGCLVEASTADSIVEMITGVDPTVEADCTIDQTELTTFVNAPDGGLAQSVIDFKDNYRSISYLINPAFFKEGADGNSTFLGTYDEGSTTYYEYTASGLAVQADTSAIDALLTLDLSNIEAYVPSVVKAATVTVE
jgi:hypothetical protein